MRLNANITITSGTALNVATALGLDAAVPQYASRWTAQALHGGAGLVTVFDGIKPRGRVPALGVSGDVTEELQSASANDPGGAYSDSFEADADNQGDVDLSLAWIDGANTGDKVAVSGNLRV